VGDKGEYDVCNCQESVDESRVGNDIVLDIVGSLDTDGNHSDDSSSQNTDGRNSRHDENLVTGSWESANTADDQTDHAEDDRASAVVGDGVEQHGKSENVAGHEENDEKQLAPVADFTADWAHENLSGVTHAVHVGIA
jgi:hypothetical protein